jgi:hypothetical protein
MSTVIGTVYTKKGREGDFDWHIQSGNFEHALFLFNDDEKRHHWKKAGTGNAVIRKYNKHACPGRPRSAGIVTGSGDTGYSELNKETQEKIDACFKEIRDIIKEQKYTTIYYSAKTPNGILGTSIFQVDQKVLEYITEQIHGLAKEE